MRFWLGLISLYLLVAVSLAIAFGVDRRLAVDLVVLGGGLLPPIIRQSPRLYLAIQRARYWITNANTSWHLNLVFDGQFSPGELEAYVATLTDEIGSQSRVLERTPDRVLLHYRRLFIIEMLLGPKSFSPADELRPPRQFEALSFTVFDQHVGYRQSKRILEHVLVPLIETLKDRMSPKRGQYGLRIQFEGPNPFLGLYLSQLRSALVRDFEVELGISDGAPEDYLRVTMRELVINSNSLEAFRRAALTGLALGKVGS